MARRARQVLTQRNMTRDSRALRPAIIYAGTDNDALKKCLYANEASRSAHANRLPFRIRRLLISLARNICNAKENPIFLEIV